MSDLENLILALRAGDLDAFGRLAVRFQNMAYAYACTRLGDLHLAESRLVSFCTPRAKGRHQEQNHSEQRR
jgi:hypothetical protein